MFACGLSLSEITSSERLYNDAGVFRFAYKATLNEGSTFGELGLLEGKPRSAMVVCSEDCEFAVIEKKDYSELLAERDKKNLLKKLDFLKKHLFPDLTNDAIRKIFYSFAKRSMKKNEVLFAQGDVATGVYIIKSGEVSLSDKDAPAAVGESPSTTKANELMEEVEDKAEMKSLLFKPRKVQKRNVSRHAS